MNKNSKILALKYRPQVLKELIGQDIVASTIYNSIKSNKIPNAYLFTGIRGVGKTTFARIVAKSLNCKNGIENINKQDSCENCHCEAIANSNHIDVLEMDAASKTGVDDVRDLIEFSRYGPTSGKYKIFIIDEVHMLSKQAFNALLKTLEEPPQYLKFIFATTEIKKIPVTVLSRCQRFDLQRVKSNELFEYLKKISNLEKGNISDEALKLIVKISEGSVRDSLSLLDRGLISKNDGDQLDLRKAQEIFGYFDKSILINLFKYIFEGNENEVMKIYKLIYNAGVEPKIFLNDFLEILYYFKNIDTLKLEGTSFSLNDSEFSQISEISKKIDSQTLILFWQFAVNTLSELDIVSNQNIAVEMFLIRLLYLNNSENQDAFQKIENKSSIESKASTKTNYQILNQENKNKSNTKVIDQIKNVSQKDEIVPKLNLKESTDKIIINDFDKLVEICNFKKEAKLKYELESNVNLVSFSPGRIEISIDNRLDKNFVKLLSEKLYEWTGERWLISFSKEKGKPTMKEKNISNKQLLIEQYKDSNQYRELKKLFSDAELVEVKNKENNS